MSEIDWSPCREEVLRAEIERLRSDRRAAIDNFEHLALNFGKLEAHIERLQKQIGELQFVLNELLLCEIDDAAETIVRRALEQKP